MDHPFVRQPAGSGHYRRSRRDRTVSLNQKIGIFLKPRTGGARNDAGDAAAMGEMAIGGIDDRVRGLFQQVTPYDQELASWSGFFAREDLRRRGRYSIFAFVLRPRTISSIFAWTSCCWIRGLISARLGMRTGRTSSSWIT
jgi:hypothetical protein